ncbi:MAG: right-handed parallel beta-helix repeat-containing protein [Fretibacterium sp.]|nr:right-handed parallel beta-helix repeat-containing protein [Fretibacterium sp.]
MYNKDSSPTVENCTFSGNTAKFFGGGMYNKDSSPTVENCTFSGNTAKQFGGGMCNWNSSGPTVANCTFSGNTAIAGGGMYNWDSSPTVANTILWGNKAFKNQGSDIYQRDAVISPNHCVVGTYRTSSNATVIPIDCITSADPNPDPKLISLDVELKPTTEPTKVYVYEPGPGSSALNAGLNAGTDIGNGVKVPDKDQRGTTRPQGAGVDIGSFERNIFFIQASWDVGGEIRPRGKTLDAKNCIEVSPRDSVTFDIVPKAGYKTADVLVDGTSVGVVPFYEFKNVNADHEIRASFVSVSAPDPNKPDPTAPEGGGCSAGGTGAIAAFALLGAALLRRKD